MSPVPILDPNPAPESAWLGGSLTWTTGFVDAIGYLTHYSRLRAALMPAERECSFYRCCAR